MKTFFLTIIIWFPDMTHPDLTYVNHKYESMASCQMTGEEWLGQLFVKLSDIAGEDLSDIKNSEAGKAIGYFCTGHDASEQMTFVLPKEQVVKI